MTFGPLRHGLVLACVLVLGCDGEATPGDAADTGRDPSADGGGQGHAASVGALVPLLPADARGALAVDLDALLAGNSATAVTALLSGDGGDPALRALFVAIRALAGTTDLRGVFTTVLLAQTTDAGLFLLAKVEGTTIEALGLEPSPTPDGAYGARQTALYLAADGNQLALLSTGVLVVGAPATVRSVLDVADGESQPGASELAAFLSALDDGAAFSFVYALPAMLDDSIAPDRSLRGAEVVSGALDFEGGEMSGAVAFHTSNAAAFVDAYNALDKDAVSSDPPLEAALEVGAELATGLGQVVVPVGPTPLEPSPGELVASRNTLKKLFIGMEAHDYAEDVADPGNAAWVDLVVKSEADDDAPPSPGSVFIRWAFRDEAAIEAFERNELPAGFSLARCQFLESDDPEGEYFLALNLYNAGGGSIVTGARAEWDVFVHPPQGADPDAGTRPRFMVIDALAQAISADPTHLVTSAEPLSHAFDGDQVVTTVGRREGEETISVFESSFPRPAPDPASVARFTRQMAIGNDYIYWGHGVYDRALYNATTFNHDAYFVDPAMVEIRDNSHWAQYLTATPRDVVYYVNTLEYVASPMANLRSEHLDITPEWLAELLAFKNNGHQLAMMRKAVEDLFDGRADALVSFRVANTTPSVYYTFEITDPEGLSERLALPAGYSLVQTPLLEGSAPSHALTLSVYEVEDAPGGTRAEWGVYVDNGSGRPRLMVIDLHTQRPAVDPVRMLHLPSDLRHDLADDIVRTRLTTPSLRFAASFSRSSATEAALALDWIEAGDHVCSRIGICDKRFYDAETLDGSVRRPADVTVDALETPWDAFIDATPRVVFFRDNAQTYAVKRWHNLKVLVPDAPFSGLPEPTHAIRGMGSLVGRTTDVVNSEYTYSGDVALGGERLTFALDQAVDSLLGEAHIFTTGGFDLATGIGTQTVIDCVGPALMCSGVVDGSTAFYTAQNLDTSDPDAITWEVNVVVDLEGSFGFADSTSRFTAMRLP